MTTGESVRLLRGFAQTPHGSIEWRGMGASGHPLVMFHPTPSSAYHFEPHFPRLAGRARVIAMSTPGYGDSDDPPEPYTSIAEFGRTALWFLDAMELERVDLYGAWTGAQIAVELAASHPERVRRIVLEEPWDYGNPEGRALHETIHRYIPEQEDGSHLVELWRKYGGDRPGVDLERFSRRFIDFLRGERRGADVRGDGPGGRRTLLLHPLPLPREAPRRRRAGSRHPRVGQQADARPSGVPRCAPERNRTDSPVGVDLHARRRARAVGRRRARLPRGRGASPSSPARRARMDARGGRRYDRGRSARADRVEAHT